MKANPSEEFRPEQIEMPFEHDVFPPIIRLEDLLVEMKRDGNKEQFQALRAALK